MTEYSIRPLCYAHVDLPAEFFGGVAIHSGEGRKTAAILYTMLSTRDEHGILHHHLVDCGFDEPWIPRFGFYDFEAPEVVLDKVGVRPEEIETVLVTHMHFDHVNNLHRFPNAEVVVQWTEYEGWSRAMALAPRFTPKGANSWVNSSCDRDDLSFFAGLAAEQRLRFVSDGDELLPGVTGHLSRDGHTFGIQWLSVETPDGPVVIASDTAMWFSNIEEMWPSGNTNGNTYNMLLTYGALAEHVGDDLTRIVPGHDMRVFEQLGGERIGRNEVAELCVAAWDSSVRGARANGAA